MGPLCRCDPARFPREGGGLNPKPSTLNTPKDSREAVQQQVVLSSVMACFMVCQCKDRETASHAEGIQHSLQGLGFRV